MATPILRYSPGGPVVAEPRTAPPSVTTFTTETEEETVNPGNPTPILEYHPGSGAPVPPWPPAPSDLTYPECGTIQLVSGQSWIDVTFAEEKPDANWIFEELQVVNTTDPTPLNIWPGIVTVKTITGFRLQLNGLPNTDNYFLHWAVGGCATSDWVVSSGVGVSNFLQLTDSPDDYTGQAGKGVKVNLTEDGLEFGVVASSGSGDAINVLDYGAVADCVTLFDITMPNGNVVTSAAHTFVEADIGKWAIIRGATDSGGYSPLIATITAVSGHTATLSLATTTALTNLYAVDSFPRMDFGTDNTWFFTLACLAVPGPGSRNFYDSVPFEAAGVMNPILPGDGGTVYIPRGNYLLVNGSPGLPDGGLWWHEQNNITIKGDGMGQTVLFMSSDTRGTMPLFGGFVPSHGLFQNLIFSDYTIHDLNYFHGNGNTLAVYGASNVRIERIEIRNSRGNGGINYQGYNTSGGVPTTNRLWIKDCWVHGVIEDGHSPSFPHSIEGDGMNVGQVRDVHIEGNTIENPGRHAYEGGGNCYDQYFIGNTIDMGDSGLSGINPTGGSTTVIMGNTIRNVYAAGYGIDVTVDVGDWVANDIRCIGNYIEGNMAAAFRFQNTSGDATVDHITRIILAENWVEGDTNVSTVGITIGGTAGSGISLQMLIEGNWFNNLGNGFSAVDFLGTGTDKWVIIRNNVFGASAGQPVDDNSLIGNVIVEDNVLLGTAANRYGGKGMSCNIDGQSVAAGATYTNTADLGVGYRTTDSVEIVRGATTAPGLIIWGCVSAANVVTTYVYNPTGGSLNTGGATTYIVHRPLP